MCTVEEEGPTTSIVPIKMHKHSKHANRVLDDSDIERTEEYEKFLVDLRAYHEKRGYGKGPFSCFTGVMVDSNALEGKTKGYFCYAQKEAENVLKEDVG